MRFLIVCTQNIQKIYKMGDSFVTRKEGLFKRWFRTHVNKGGRKYDEETMNNLRNEI